MNMADLPVEIQKLDLNALTQEDREFLHDIANPLAIAGGLVEAYREEISRTNLKLTESQDRKLTKIANALDRIEKLITERRQRLIAIQNATKEAALQQSAKSKA
jgi:signal transduction histidine kinase